MAVVGWHLPGNNIGGLLSGPADWSRREVPDVDVISEVSSVVRSTRWGSVHRRLVDLERLWFERRSEQVIEGG